MTRRIGIGSWRRGVGLGGDDQPPFDKASNVTSRRGHDVPGLVERVVSEAIVNASEMPTRVRLRDTSRRPPRSSARRTSE